ncbi:MAG: GNAT family N-acetyltransferase [Candidatus Hodarchaeota archaeon]
MAKLREELLGKFNPARFKSYIKENPDLVLIILENKRIVGYCIGIVLKEGKGSIYQIGVDKSHLNKGYRKRLLNSIIDALRRRYCHEIRTGFVAEESLGFFLKHGFKVQETILSQEKTDFVTHVKGNQQVLIRPFKMDDLDVLLELEQKCFEPFWHTTREEFIQWANLPEASFFVGLMNETAVAYNFNVIREKIGQYARIAVHPNYRRQGIGTRLTVNAIEWFRKRGVRKILLNTQVDNIEARNMYKKLGFRILEKLYVMVMKI